MGKNINTEGNEMFPFVHDDGLLFFASNGLPGLGGLDIFVAKLTDSKTAGTPMNLGAPVNSSYDDFALILDKDQKNGYFSSNRLEGRCDDDIYCFEMNKPISFDTQNNQTQNSNVNNQVVKAPTFSLYCLVTNKETKSPIEGATITLKDNFTGKSETFITTTSGDFTKKLDFYKLNDKVNFDVKIEKNGFLTKTANYSKTLAVPGQYNIHEEIDMNLLKIEVGSNLGALLNINPIYFDYDKSLITPKASIELDKIEKVLNDNPTMEIELGSHTDSRGSAEYNIKLSDRRAKASAEYIKNRITNPDRIYGKGYGATQLLNKCVKCTEDEHQMNRRTEFKIVKF